MKDSSVWAVLALICCFFGGWGRELFGMPPAWVMPLGVAGFVAAGAWVIALFLESRQKE